MAAPYTTQTISGYNTNPPSDDGASTATNRTTWAGVKTKLADPVKTQVAAIDSALVAGIAKLIGGGGVTTSAVDYTVQSTDQGKLVQMTGGSTLTTPDAATVTSPFVFAVTNNSGTAITLDGSGAQTIDGNASATLAVGSGCFLFTDGSNWFSTGLSGTLVGKQLMYGDIINGTIAESNSSNAVTFSLKTLAGNTPSATDPVLLAFRNSTAGTGNYIYRTVTAALTLTISSGSTMGFTSAVAGKLWLVLFDDAGTIRMGAINCLSGTSVYPLGQMPLASSTAEGGAGARDSAHVFVTDTAVTSKPYLLLGYASYETGIATAGSWNASPTRLQLFGPGVPLPGNLIQLQRTATGASATGATVIPHDDTIPQNTEGDQYMSQAITPSSASNLLTVAARGLFASNAGNFISMALFQDSTAGALAAVTGIPPTTAEELHLSIDYAMQAGTTSATTFKARAGSGAAATITFNGVSSARIFGGVMNSYMEAREIMA